MKTLFANLAAVLFTLRAIGQPTNLPSNGGNNSIVIDTNGLMKYPRVLTVTNAAVKGSLKFQGSSGSSNYIYQDGNTLVFSNAFLKTNSAIFNEDTPSWFFYEPLFNYRDITTGPGAKFNGDGSGLTNLNGSGVSQSKLDATNTALIALSYDLALGNTNYTTAVSNALWFRSLSNFITGKTIWVMTNGSDAFGLRGFETLPFRTIGEAKTNALAGDMVVVMPGNYTNNNLLKPGVHYNFKAGAKVYWNEDQTGNGFGIFDDRAGATTNIIAGDGEFYYSTGTTGYFSGTISATVQPTNLALIKGLFYSTNASTVVNLKATKLSIETIAASGFDIAAIAVDNCRSVIIQCPQIIDPNKDSATIQWGLDIDQEPQFTPSTASGIYWKLGELYITTDIIDVRGYAVWAAEPSGNTAAQNLWVNGKKFRGNGVASTLYMDGKTTNYKMWVTGLEIESTNAGSFGAVVSYTGGKVYVTAQKISARAAAISTVGDAEVWINSQKISSPYRWAEFFGGKTTLDCLQYEDTSGTMNAGFFFANGSNYIRGGVGVVTNAPGLIWRGGQVTLDGITLHEQNPGAVATNAPIWAMGTNGSLRLKDMTLLGGGTNSIYATNAQTVLADGVLTSTNAIHSLVSLFGLSQSNGNFRAVSVLANLVSSKLAATNATVARAAVIGAGNVVTNANITEAELNGSLAAFNSTSNAFLITSNAFLVTSNGLIATSNQLVTLTSAVNAGSNSFVTISNNFLGLSNAFLITSNGLINTSNKLTTLTAAVNADSNAFVIVSNNVGNLITLQQNIQPGAGITLVTNNVTNVVVSAPGYTIGWIANIATTAPADGLIYYPIDLFSSANIDYTNAFTYIPRNGTLKWWEVRARISTVGTSEAVQHYLRLNNATDVGRIDLSYTVTNVAAFTNLSQAVTTNDTLAFKIVCPTWVTNPQTVRWVVNLYIE